MAHYGVLRDYRFDSADEIRGAKIYGINDEKLGKIDDVIFDHDSGTIRYAVIDAGGWLSSKKFLVPTDRLRASTEHDGDFSVDMTKQQIESLPPYQENDLEQDEKWSNYENRYRAKWEMGPVMHRAETDRNITPTTEQLQGNRTSIDASHGISERTRRFEAEPTDSANADIQAAEANTGRVVPAGMDSVVINNSAAGIGGRWDTFQARLRERRKEAVASCKSCSIGPRSESADTWKKAV